MTGKFQYLGRFIPLLAGVAVMVLTALAIGDARAAWPERTVTIIVPFPPGGPNDLLGRLLAVELAPKLGQNVIVENRAVLLLPPPARRLHPGGRYRCGADQSERR